MPLSDPPSPIETTAKALVSLVPGGGRPALVTTEPSGRFIELMFQHC
jgi:hypothetical protein